MKILSFQFKNFASYGNRVQEIVFDKTHSELYLTVGANGSGKCLSGETEIDIEIEDPVVREKFIKFINEKNLP